MTWNSSRAPSGSMAFGTHELGLHGHPDAGLPGLVRPSATWAILRDLVCRL